MKQFYTENNLLFKIFGDFEILSIQMKDLICNPYKQVTVRCTTCGKIKSVDCSYFVKSETSQKCTHKNI